LDRSGADDGRDRAQGVRGVRDRGLPAAAGAGARHSGGAAADAAATQRAHLQMADRRSALAGLLFLWPGLERGAALLRVPLAPGLPPAREEEALTGSAPRRLDRGQPEGVPAQLIAAKRSSK